MIEYRFRAEGPDGRRITLNPQPTRRNDEILLRIMRGKARDWWGKDARLVVESRTVTEWSETE